MGREQHSRRTDSALRSTTLDKGALQRRYCAIGREPFHSRDITALDLTGRDQATIDDLAIDQNRACAALSFAAAFFCAGLVKVFAQYIEKTA